MLLTLIIIIIKSSVYGHESFKNGRSEVGPRTFTQLRITIDAPDTHLHNTDVLYCTFAGPAGEVGLGE